MAAHGIPAPELLCAVSIGLETLGGLSLVLGLHARAGAAVLALFLIPVTLVFHVGPEQKIQFLKNLGILGGLLQILAFGPGEISMDRARG